MRAPILVLGIGNELFTDEGLGPTAARRLAALGLPGVDVLDGATLGLALLPELTDRTGLLVLDAIVAGAAPAGDIVALDRDEIGRPTTRLLSAHQVGIGEALATAEFAGRLPTRVAAVGMVPASLETGYGLSTLATQRLPELLTAAIRTLRDWGVPIDPQWTEN